MKRNGKPAIRNFDKSIGAKNGCKIVLEALSSQLRSTLDDHLRNSATKSRPCASSHDKNLSYTEGDALMLLTIKRLVFDLDPEEFWSKNRASICGRALCRLLRHLRHLLKSLNDFGTVRVYVVAVGFHILFAQYLNNLLTRFDEFPDLITQLVDYLADFDDNVIRWIEQKRDSLLKSLEKRMKSQNVQRSQKIPALRTDIKPRFSHLLCQEAIDKVCNKPKLDIPLTIVKKQQAYATNTKEQNRKTSAFYGLAGDISRHANALAEQIIDEICKEIEEELTFCCGEIADEILRKETIFDRAA